MPKFPVFTPQKIVKILEKNGFKLIRQKGSHQIFENIKTNLKVTVPFHNKDLPIGTVKSIFKMANIEV